ncbi:hypothetical protein DFQ28_001051 [Apophysomyces sp. BC1034]|nr:hypothetical protein DFQ30_008889 [Apophysomyces sp. BC1015]KAG0181390.1 hypothetical protein DFQ29_008447 [Apophysomyces sp. BC1021]KAG0191056.1 hypothetical protein DFQ28_001051 [Apophysomyces sp. BC1034]
MSTTETLVYTRSEARRLPRPPQEMPPLFDEPITWQNWCRHVNWTQSILLIGTPAIAGYGLLTTELQTKTLIWALVYYLITGLGITAGYHRLWAHRSFQATVPFQILCCLAGSGAVQGSIHWWSRGHRAHHRWTDSDKDPYAATRGFFFSHIGWMLIRRPKGRIGYADTDDLRKDTLVRLQHKYYPFFALFMGFAFPAWVASYGWGDARGGFFYAGVLRLVLVHHATFCVNSLAHFLGETTYDDVRTPKDHWITALVTMGEGYHNFHHEFPQDYRNAILFYQWDPTKWLIKALSWIHLTYDLKTFPSNEIQKGRLQMIEKRVVAEKCQLNFGKPLSQLPIYTMEEYQNLVNRHNKKWILMDGLVYDVEHLDHPGGEKYIHAAVGKDASKSFNGGIYNHSNGARNLLASLRVGIIKESFLYKQELKQTYNK